MLTLLSRNGHRSCDGASRRDFLRIGSLGVAGLSLSTLLRARAAAAEEVKQKSVIWIWLSGGPTHIETFDPKMSAPSEYRSILGEVKTPVPGITLGGGHAGNCQTCR